MHFTHDDDQRMIKFLEEKARFAGSPLTMTVVWKEFKETDENKERCERSYMKRFRRLRERLDAFQFLSTEAKLRILFVTRSPVEKTFLEKIKKEAYIVEVDEKGVIVKYEKGDLVLLNCKSEVKRRISLDEIEILKKVKVEVEEDDVQMIEMNNEPVAPEAPEAPESPSIDVKILLILIRRVILFLGYAPLEELYGKLRNSIKTCNSKQIPINIALLAINNIFTAAHSSIDDGSERTSLKYFLKQLKCNICELEGSEFEGILMRIENEIQMGEDKLIPISNIHLALETAFTLAHNAPEF